MTAFDDCHDANAACLRQRSIVLAILTNAFCFANTGASPSYGRELWHSAMAWQMNSNMALWKRARSARFDGVGDRDLILSMFCFFTSFANKIWLINR